MEKVISSKKVFECPKFWVEELEVELPDGKRAKRWHVVKGDAAVTICVRNKKILMLREFRSASGKIEWWLPGGRVNKNEDPKDAAVRETREEVGLEPIDIQLIRSVKNPSATTRQTAHYFVATKFRENPLDTGDDEEKWSEIKELSFEEVRRLMDEGVFGAKIEKALREFFNSEIFEQGN